MSLFKKYFSLLITLSIGVIIYQCAGDPVNLSQDFVSGKVTFTDTLMTRYTGGFYAVYVYPDSTNPFSQVSPAGVELVPITLNSVSTADYKVTGLNGRYYIAVVWVRRSDNSVRSFLGTYGCDTVPVASCTTLLKVEVPNFAGTGALNIRSYTDTTRRVYP